MSNKSFKEEYLFNKYKDEHFNNSGDFKKRIREYKEVDASELYKRIINYQVKKYGGGLTGDLSTHVPIEVLKRRSKQRRYHNEKKLGIKKNAKMQRWIDHE